MFYIQTVNVFGICQLGEWDTFDHNNVESDNKRIIDFSKPFPLWLPVLQELSNLFIVSKFTVPEDITVALDLIKLCRNSLVFITVITPSICKTRNDLVELKNSVDIFLGVEDIYCEKEVFTDPASYAVDFMAQAFDKYVDKQDFKPCYDDQFYAFSQSGCAKLISFQLPKNSYKRYDICHLPEEVIKQVNGKYLAYFNIKYSKDCKSWLLGLMIDALKEASGNMYFASGCTTPDRRMGSTIWVTAIISDMDNPNNSYGSSLNKTAFQR